jgi:hypothetical protein
MAKANGKSITQREKWALVLTIIARLRAEQRAVDDAFIEWLATPGEERDEVMPTAKDARLWRLGVATGDLEQRAPHLFQRRQHSHARLDYKRDKPDEMVLHGAQVAVIECIRETIAKRIGNKRGIEPLVVEIAAEILFPDDDSEVAQGKVSEIIKHGQAPRLLQQAPAAVNPTHVQGIRDFLERKIGKAPTDEQLVAYAAKVLHCSPDEIRAIIKPA